AVQAICSDGATKSAYVQTVGSTNGTCSQPTALIVSNITSTSAKISWTGTCNATLYSVQYRVTGTVLWTTVTTTAKNKTLSGLTANTSYDYRVRSECGGGN